MSASPCLKWNRMGTWGPGTFDDDIACDWIEDLYDSDPIAFFIACLNLDGIEIPEQLACVGVACTAETLHALVCGPRDGLPEALHQWREDHRELDVRFMLPSACDGLRRVLDPRSAMHVMWADNQPMYGEWLEKTEDLLSRLDAAVAAMR